MNSDSLLNIINIIIKNEEKFEESPNEIYSLFKKHGYERDIETLKLDLKNLLNDVIKNDEELSKVAGGKVSKLAAGAVAALTCFPMNSFASGTANTNQNEHSAVNKITDAIKSGAKKVGDATKEYVIEPAKDAAKTIARNPGKSAAVATAIVLSNLLSGLAGKKLASPPKVDTHGMTEKEKKVVENTRKVLEELTKNFYVVPEDKEKENNEEENKKEENKKYSWDLDKLSEKPEGKSGKVRIGELVTALMPEKVDSGKASYAYTQQKKTFIDYEKAQLKTIEKFQQKLDEQKPEGLDKLKNEKENLQQLLKAKDEEIEKKKEEIEKQKQELEEALDKNKNNNEMLGNGNDEKLKKKNEELEKEKKEKEDVIKQKTDELEKIKDELNKKNVELENTKQQLAEASKKKDENIGPHNKETVQQLTKQYAELQEQMKDQVEALKQAKEQLAEKEKEIDEMKKQNVEKIQEEVNKKINEHQEKQQKQQEELEQLQQEKHTLQEKLNALEQKLPADRNKQLLLTSYPNLEEIYNTIDNALGTNVLQPLKQQVSNKSHEACCNTFRKISNTLRKENNRSTEIVKHNKLSGTLSLAEILLLSDLINGVAQGNIVHNAKDFEGFNLTINTEWEKIKQLKTDSETINSWVTWLTPVKNGWFSKGGIKETNVVKQLPELILAAATFKNSKTLTSLLTALQQLLTMSDNSSYRKDVNNALSKIGMRFDETTCSLVSTSQEKK